MQYGISFYIIGNLISATVHLDYFIKEWLQVREVSWLIQVMSLITDLGSPIFFALLSILVFIWLGWRKRWMEAVFTYICLLSAWLLMDYLKLVFERPRPMGEVFTVAAGFSFPSGHAMISMAYYGFLAVLLFTQYRSRWSRFVAIGFLALILCIGFSRIYLNVHYFSDVMVGYVLGLLVLYANWRGLAWARRKYFNFPS